ncbi:MAG: guanosine monophosphate reductase [Microgenomates group bacterium]
MKISKIFTKKEELTFDDILLLPGKSKIPLEDDYKIDISTWLTKRTKIKIPIISAGMVSVTEWEMAEVLARNGGIGAIHSFLTREEQIRQVKKVKKNNLLVAACVYEGWSDLFNHIKKLYEAKLDVLVIESYHAYNSKLFNIVREIKKRFSKLDIIVGNVVTKEATEYLCKAGADAIKVGIGSGSHCTTRIVTGFGRPQLSAIFECYKIAKKFGVPIIADGGIRSTGDIIKALIFGANAVMIGGLLAGYKQSPGKLIIKKGIKYKESFGSCTLNAVNKNTEFKISRIIKIKNFLKNFLLNKREIKEEFNDFLEEGVGGLIKYKGDVTFLIKDIVKSIKRGLWYAGAMNIKELQKKSNFVIVSTSTIKENLPAYEILSHLS